MPRPYRISIKQAVMGLSIWFAILSLLATIHADVFEQEDHPLWAIIASPVSRIFQAEPSSVKLSSLLPNPRLLDLGASDKRKYPLYIFMLDLSMSMVEQQVSEQEVGQYLEDIQAAKFAANQSPIYECFVKRGVSVTKGYDIARSELCRYIDALPLNSRAALWSFGDAPHIIVPSDNSQNGARYIPIETDKDGGDTRRVFYPAILKLMPEQKHSDFEQLLSTIAAKYRDAIEGDEEVHFVLISDFVHDIGGDQNPNPGQDLIADIGTSSDSLLQSKYRASVLSIEGRLREMSRGKNKTFHLAVVRGARRIICSVLPIANKSVSRDGYREVRFDSGRLATQFDFLRAYRQLSEPLVFYYTPGNTEPKSLRIEVDDGRLEGGKLRVGLASQTLSNFAPFNVKIIVPKKEGDGGFASPGESFVGKVPHKGEIITLQPETILDPREASTYRLLLSWQADDREEKKDEIECTFTLRIEFKRRLSLYGALAMLGSILAVLFFLAQIGLDILTRIFTRFREAKPPAEQVSGHAA